MKTFLHTLDTKSYLDARKGKDTQGIGDNFVFYFYVKWMWLDWEIFGFFVLNLILADVFNFVLKM